MVNENNETILLKNCFYIWPGCDEPPLKGCDILLKDDVIASIGNNLLNVTDLNIRVIDCSDHVVLPGFVNTHHHFYQTLTRNIP
ncbi:8-oxoguanine deaminase, partial [bacterium]|nr:8-oxoguanine deaminase [bacterium]